MIFKGWNVFDHTYLGWIAASLRIGGRNVSVGRRANPYQLTVIVFRARIVKYRECTGSRDVRDKRDRDKRDKFDKNCHLGREKEGKKFLNPVFRKIYLESL